MQSAPSPQSDAATDPPDEGAALIAVFGERLSACLDAAGYPGINSGRYSSLGNKYGASRQQANRWCTGLAVPPPHILTRMAADLNTSIDWLFGVDSKSADGIEVPLFKLRSPDIEAAYDNFLKLGAMKFLPSSPVGGRRYAIVQNWAETLDPPFALGDELLVDLSSQDLEVGAAYIIRTPTSTSVRKFSIDRDGVTLCFSRLTPMNRYSQSYQIDQVHYNEEQRFDVDWRQPGVLVLGRVEAVSRSLLPQVPSFFSS